MTVVDQIKQAGVVGAGGAGFPTHVKMSSSVDFFLINGAECEPLMHKDRELMINFAPEIIKGVKLAYTTIGAKKAVIGIKSKNKKAIDTLKAAIDDPNISIYEFGDYYPVGDEYELVYGITGKLIPPQGLPLDVGCVVNNVETVYNIYQASQNTPVINTFLTITGLVKNPLSTQVPIGMSVAEVLELAGGPTVGEYAIMESGLMMGKLIKDINQPVTKTTGGLIVLPADHNLIQRYQTTPEQQAKIGHSACDQCSYCTELCPRYLLGYDIQPHLAMRSLGFTVMGNEVHNSHALLCSQCGVCALYSCPEGLYPREACSNAIQQMKKINKGKWQGSTRDVHPMRDHRRLPLKQLKTRLGVTEFESEAVYHEISFNVKQVTIPVKQHVGVAARPVVKPGQTVKKGQLVASINDGDLGANIHASIAGTVKQVNNNYIMIERD